MSGNLWARVGDSLTLREEQILDGLAEGLTSPEIAAELNLATETVKFHSGSLRRKLGARNAAQAVAIAYHRGLLVVPKQAA